MESPQPTLIKSMVLINLRCTIYYTTIIFGVVVSNNRNYRNHRGRGRHRNDRNNRERYIPPHSSKRPSNLTVIPRPGENPERAIKRFLKKCKKLRIVETHREKTDYYEKPSVIKRRKAIRRQRAIKKANQKNIQE